MKYEIQNSESINFSKEQPSFKIGNREIYKCKFKKDALKVNSNLLNIDLYYMTKNHKEINNGAYVVIQFDKERENILFFEYMRKPNEDMETVEYVVYELIRRLNHNLKDFEKDKEDFIYFNITL